MGAGGERERVSLDSKDVSPNDSEPDSASLRLNGGGQTAKGVEARNRQGRNGHMHLSGRPGWLGRARVERSVKEPGRPGAVYSTEKGEGNICGESITCRMAAAGSRSGP
jgi:hypothetical protein